MFKRDHHQKVSQLLSQLNPEFLLAAQCYFGGGTAPVLLLNEYRESVDVDFLCASQDGYRQLRETISSNSLGEIARGTLDYAREIRGDQYGIRTFIKIDGVAIKFEIVREARVSLTGAQDRRLGVPLLSRLDLFTQKLLANADRGDDRSTHGRDLIDLSMMAHHWGGIPIQAWDKAHEAYGQSVKRSFVRVLNRLLESNDLHADLRALRIDDAMFESILQSLRAIAIKHK